MRTLNNIAIGLGWVNLALLVVALVVFAVGAGARALRSPVTSQQLPPGV